MVKKRPEKKVKCKQMTSLLVRVQPRAATGGMIEFKSRSAGLCVWFLRQTDSSCLPAWIHARMNALSCPLARRQLQAKISSRSYTHNSRTGKGRHCFRPLPLFTLSADFSQYKSFFFIPFTTEGKLHTVQQRPAQSGPSRREPKRLHVPSGS